MCGGRGGGEGVNYFISKSVCNMLVNSPENIRKNYVSYKLEF